MSNISVICHIYNICSIYIKGLETNLSDEKYGSRKKLYNIWKSISRVSYRKDKGGNVEITDKRQNLQIICI